MFTGIVEETGRIETITPKAAAIELVVRSRLCARGLKAGDSVAVNGVCLTATAIAGGGFAADVSHETLSRTTGLDRRGPVNLETSLRAGDRLGGHLVAGHVDGVSLTINRVEDHIAAEPGDCEISINLIPHTLAATTLRRLETGARVNLEADLIARYVARMLEVRPGKADGAADFS